MTQLTVYTVPNCIDCAAVKNLLQTAGVPFHEVDISQVPGSREALSLLSGLSSVPQVFHGNQFIGQVFEIRTLVQTGEIQRLAESQPTADQQPRSNPPTEQNNGGKL